MLTGNLFFDVPTMAFYMIAFGYSMPYFAV